MTALAALLSVLPAAVRLHGSVFGFDGFWFLVALGGGIGVIAATLYRRRLPNADDMTRQQAWTFRLILLAVVAVIIAIGLAFGRPYFGFIP